MRALTLLTLATLVACGGSAKDTAGTDTASSSDTASGTSDGATLFADHCAACHGSDGTNGYAPDLSQKVPTMDDTELDRVIANGKGGMPAISLSATERSTLVAYLRSTFG